EEEEAEKPEPKGIGAVEVPPRWLYCLDLRDHADHRVYVDEVKRIAAECQARRETKPLLQLGLAAAKPEVRFAAEQLLAQPGRRCDADRGAGARQGAGPGRPRGGGSDGGHSEAAGGQGPGAEGRPGPADGRAGRAGDMRDGHDRHEVSSGQEGLAPLRIPSAL